MTAADIRECLAKRWPDSEYLHIVEAPQRADRSSGRKLDVLVISLWESRGLQCDGIEIKVSLSDWRRELKNGAKADWWFRHVHRFWLAVPAGLADAILEDLPVDWGLLSCEPGVAAKVVRQAKLHDPEPLPWSACVGIMRAAADAGFNALQRAKASGYEIGYQHGKRDAERQSAENVARRELEALRYRVAEFEQASGLSISETRDIPRDVGTLVALIRSEIKSPGWTALTMGRAARVTVDAAERLVESAREVERTAERISEILAEAATHSAHPDAQSENDEPAATNSG